MLVTNCDYDCNNVFHTYLSYRIDEIPKQIQSNTELSDSMAIWGYEPRLHVESQTPFGVRFPTPFNIVNDYPTKQMMLDAYIRDLTSHKPVFFLHATGPGHHILNKPEYSYINFPAIHDIIKIDYSLLYETENIQLFKRDL